jgi:hypothetical protein
MTPPNNGQPAQGPVQDESHNGGQGRNQAGEMPWVSRQDSVDIAYGGLNMAARGSIVVLVILLAGNAVFTFMTYAWLNTKIDAVVNPQNVMLDNLKVTMDRYRGAQESDIRAVRQDIIANRDYLREVGRTCLLTNDQKIKFQQNMSAGMRELLMRDYLNPIDKTQ